MARRRPKRMPRETREGERMKGEAQREIARELIGQIKRREAPQRRESTVEAWIYTDPERATRERSMLGQWPRCAGLTGSIRAPNTFRAERAGHTTSTLLVRDGEGTLHAFTNACLHRGAELATEATTSGDAIRCPYHGWTYDCEGRLQSTRAQREKRLDGRAVTEQAGLLWIADNDEALARRPTGALAKEIETFGLTELNHYAQRTSTRKLNWKVAVETFLEFHHLPVLHAQTSAPTFIAHASTVKSFGPHLRLAVARTTIEKALASEERTPRRHFTLLYLLFPRTILVLHWDQVMLFRTAPHGSNPNTSTTRVDFYTPESARDGTLRAKRQNDAAAIEATLEEDFATGEGIQRNARANPRAVWTHGAEEEGLRRWHASLERSLAQVPLNAGV